MNDPKIEYRKKAEEALNKMCAGCVRDVCLKEFMPYELQFQCTCDFREQFHDTDDIQEWDWRKHSMKNGIMCCKDRLEDWKLWNKCLGGEE